MVLTKEELIAALKHEIHILLHLASKVDPAKLDYRPTSTQRSLLELLQYLAVMGPAQVAVVKNGVFDRAGFQAVWGPADAVAKKMTFDAACDAIRKQADQYQELLAGWTDADLRSQVSMFGTVYSRGALLVNMLLGGHAAYRTQLFCYLKSCGREELNTMNLWAGVDAPV